MSDFDDHRPSDSTPPSGFRPSQPPPPQAFPSAPQQPAPQPWPAQAAPPSYGQQPYGQPSYGQGAPPPYAQQPYGQQPGAAPYGYAPQTPFGAAPKVKRRAIVGGIVMLIGALLAAVGSWLPWVSFDGPDFLDLPSGFEDYYFGDSSDPTLWANPGAYVLGAAVIVGLLAILALATYKSSVLSVFAILATIASGTIALAAIGIVGNVISDAGSFDLSIGPGIALVALGALVSFVGAIVVAATKG